MSQDPIYQVIIKERLGFARPYPSSREWQDIYDHIARARETYTTGEPMILYAADQAGLEKQWDELKLGGTVRALTLTQDGFRMALEFQKLRDEYPTGKSRSIFEAGFTQDEIKSIIRLMKRVSDGELGGPNDGDQDQG